MEFGFQIVSAISASAAAVLWLLSALVKTPRSISVIDLGFLDGTPKSKDDLDRLTAALIRQARWNAMGALCACVAAATQAALLWTGATA